MGDKTAAGGSAHERPQVGEPLNFCEFLEISERGGGLSPTIKAQNGPGQARHGFEQGFVHGHVEGGSPWSGAEEVPGARERHTSGEKIEDPKIKIQRRSEF